MLHRRQWLSLSLMSVAGALCTVAAPVPTHPASDPDLLFLGDWSDDVEGLIGRLLIARGKLLADGKLRETVAYLELRYAPPAVEEMERVYFDPNLACEMRSASGDVIPQHGRGGGGGGRPSAQWIYLPYDSTIRLRLSPYGFGSQDGLRMIIGPNEWNVADNDKQIYFLSGSFESDPPVDRAGKMCGAGS